MLPPRWSFIYIFFLIGPAHQSQDTQENIMTMKGFNNSLGTFVEYEGRASLAMEDWTILASFNMEILHQEIETFLQVYKTFEVWCSKWLCPFFLKPDLVEFKGSTLYDGLLRKMDPLDLRFPPSADEIEKLLMGKTSVINSRMNVIKGSEWDLKDRMNRLQFDIKEAVNSSNYDNGHILLNQLDLLAGHIKRSEDAILDAVTAALAGRLSPRILSVQQLETEITRIQAHLPPARRLSFHHSTISDVYRLATVSAQLMDNYIIFKIMVPLIDVGLFNIYRLTPIPRVLENGKIELIDTEAPLVAINDHQDRYFPLQNLDDCTELGQERFICRNRQITYGKGDASCPCALAAIRNQSSGECNLRRLHQNSIWTPLLAPNSWMVTLTKELTLVGVCFGDRQELIINGSGILSIRSDCVVKSSDVGLQGKPQLRKASKVGYASMHSTNETCDYNCLRQHREVMVPIAIIAGGSSIVLIVIFIFVLAWFYYSYRKWQVVQKADPVNDMECSQGTDRETTTSNLPLLEKPSA
ncbi:hypothetical protein KR009_002806 [Drosophila setifemur]|nr:hypothetical protein KR009_002806 [Drosophila setifemur]